MPARQGRRPSANPGRLLTGRGLRRVLRLRRCSIVRASAHHILMDCGGRRVTVPMLKGHVPHSTLRAIARTLGPTWRHLYS